MSRYWEGRATGVCIVAVIMEVQSYGEKDGRV